MKRTKKNAEQQNNQICTYYTHTFAYKVAYVGISLLVYILHIKPSNVMIFVFSSSSSVLFHFQKYVSMMCEFWCDKSVNWNNGWNLNRDKKKTDTCTHTHMHLCAHTNQTECVVHWSFNSFVFVWVLLADAISYESLCVCVCVYTYHVQRPWFTEPRKIVSTNNNNNGKKLMRTPFIFFCGIHSMSCL